MGLKTFLAGAIILGALPAIAGTPVDEEVICPVGGEKFTITGTMSCSTEGVTMSLRQQTTCDFVTRLPVCPSNALPLYREFSEAEVNDLQNFVQTDAYMTLAGKSPYLRAYAVERQLAGTGTEVSYWILASGLWFDGDALRADPEAFSLYVTEAETEKQRVSAEDRPYMLAVTAFHLSTVGRDDDARSWLAEAQAATDGSDFLEAYIKAVDKCIGNMTDESCDPEATFDPQTK